MPQFPIIVASDLTGRSDRVLERCRIIGGEMVVVHVVSGESKLSFDTHARLSAIAREDLGETSGQVDLQILCGDIPSTISKLAKERRARLIATGVASFDSPKDFVLGTTVDYLVRQASSPILVVKRRATRSYGRIVVATDFSSCSRAGLLKALELFPDCTVRLVHAYGPTFPGFLDPAETSQMNREEGAKEMEAFLLALPDYVRSKVEPLLVQGSLYEAVERQRGEGCCDLLVLGTNGRGGLAHAVVGSVASNMLNCAACDVLMVREVGA